jgi:Tannase-like family of unknown function (DUF6351)
MVTEGFPFAGPATPANFDPWSRREMNLSPDGGTTPAPRTEGSIEAMHAAYESGMVFDGDIDIPIIDWRHYLEDELDMHHSHQSFATRQRMLDADGDAGNQVIWFTDARPAVAFDQTPLAFEVIDEWMGNIAANPEGTVAENRPARAVDSCFDTGGKPARVRTRRVGRRARQRARRRVHTTVRDQPLLATRGRWAVRGSVFKCQLQPVAAALAAGIYGSWQPDAAQQARLQQIFPTGVCDWTLPDAGRPTG